VASDGNLITARSRCETPQLDAHSTDMPKDYYPLLKRAIDGLERNTREARCSVYERARTVLIDQLHKRQAPPAVAEVPHELLALEEAVRKVETEAAPHLQEPDELSVPKLGPRLVPARLAADPQEAVAALAERDADGRRRHRWPAFIHAQPQLAPSPTHAEGLKAFADLVREAEAPMKREQLREPARVLGQDEDSFIWVTPHPSTK
jgi:hypothetical protein